MFNTTLWPYQFISVATTTAYVLFLPDRHTWATQERNCLGNSLIRRWLPLTFNKPNQTFICDRKKTRILRGTHFWWTKVHNFLAHLLVFNQRAQYSQIYSTIAFHKSIKLFYRVRETQSVNRRKHCLRKIYRTIKATSRVKNNLAPILRTMNSCKKVKSTQDN